MTVSSRGTVGAFFYLVSLSKHARKEWICGIQFVLVIFQICWRGKHVRDVRIQKKRKRKKSNNS